jgi:5-methylcytosine-specific restriction endonuclease McrA
MTSVASFENVARQIRTTIYPWPPIPVRPPQAQTSYTRAQMNPSKMRLQVLRRDHYRCRSCNRTGDEITLEVREICPRASTIDEMLTLCAQCRSLVEQRDITASDAHDFLEQLRYWVSSVMVMQSKTF